MFYIFFFWNRWVMETQTTTAGKGQRTWLRIAMRIGSTPANPGRILPEKLQLQWPRLRSFSGTPIRSTPTSCSTMPSRSCIYHIPAHISNSILQKYNMSLVTTRTLRSLSNSTLSLSYWEFLFGPFPDLTVHARKTMPSHSSVRLGPSSRRRGPP